MFHLTFKALQAVLFGGKNIIFKYCIPFYSFFLFLSLWKQLAQSYYNSYIFNYVTGHITIPIKYAAEPLVLCEERDCSFQ